MADRRQDGARPPRVGRPAASNPIAFVGGAMCLVGVETALYSPFTFGRPLLGIGLLVTGLGLMIGGGFLLVRAFWPAVIPGLAASENPEPTTGLRSSNVGPESPLRSVRNDEECRDSPPPG